MMNSKLTYTLVVWKDGLELKQQFNKRQYRLACALAKKYNELGYDYCIFAETIEPVKYVLGKKHLLRLKH